MLIDIFGKHDIKCRGVIHVGASDGQELSLYLSQGLRMVLIEALPASYARLACAVAGKPNIVIANECLSDKIGEAKFWVSSNHGVSSSLLCPKSHLARYPEVTFQETTTRTTTLARFLQLYPLAITDYDLLNIDVQGAELLVLRGLGSLLGQISHLYLEVNREPLYDNCALVGDIDEYVETFGFFRKETVWTDKNWGEALYQKWQPATGEGRFPAQVYLCEQQG